MHETVTLFIAAHPVITFFAGALLGGYFGWHVGYVACEERQELQGGADDGRQSKRI
jgi:hypothetical protein